jgi:hypothetical protein
MIDILGLVAISVIAFVATNIDDIFVLMMFFSSLTFPVRQVVLGQYRNWFAYSHQCTRFLNRPSCPDIHNRVNGHNTDNNRH